MKLYVYKKNWSISMLSKILTLFFIGSFSLAAYNVGDTVSIVESKPISKLKKWIVLSNSGEKS